MLSCQKHLFDLPDDIHYLNGAYMSPQLLVVEAIGKERLSIKNRPYLLGIDDFFQSIQELKAAFAQLVNIADPNRVAIIPSVSYGIANAARNIQLSKGQKIILVEEQFPSNYYTWEKLARQNDAVLQVIKAPLENAGRTQSWNEALLQSIDPQTAMVAIGNVHWADGTLFDLHRVRQKTKAVGALLIVDGTQSVGALPFDVERIQPDALICAGYKWLLGPYSFGMAYYGEAFDGGDPIEENWINRLHSEDFQNLVRYQSEYRPMASRYSVGEQSNFILAPMQLTAIRQLLDWGVQHIQDYCQNLLSAPLQELQNMGCSCAPESLRAHHLVGIRLPGHFDLEKLKAAAQKRQVFISFRGNAIRLSPNVYNTAEDMAAFLDCFEVFR
ncbi:MAG TPA: aminotransferase class V-fold PLP-dependent enzyme [Saprospiraceae bacterium]|nr:aminotransferase class V-fold PLP-dependent enzyme [Saprospiraceae bacterium]HMQ81612.1 aminotransferase class V-fold PLP-dependent enzyme [Saprospiraceae bacterium]